ncbi:uncharacterized protein LOC123527447 [Mercenaria mercenaria]|uniref:uncharacterized protein LOC123527447 n=1 Tax=Mercenaria mercenaria TaxID=6596 RepID=UPI00234F5421|nr:uncharacterized protein LOC123527447 [Mercenaria mercenaria]XP_053379388.1 uncharacterized protein LOC123527447 [Mercenaria mercenaria]XP_053379389.1 uncharacterized protein LOC123527447 [Mercenaria mercenaria]XP_053379390.1 uncharacterized protein LOC123527447 [Mercenaria mercenaria]XP_053379391.1 uncharacterized protein LOC123527447 [Mercenaria mercenaria]XP_053379392.1 uncharacterized protein LOC123527447 [Mercenaria mercenaria]XP_053379393.1 uncharacterized protein LOC123527447 [Mercen
MQHFVNMATAQPSQDRVHLFRLQTLIIDGGTTVIRNIIDQKSSNVPFNVFLSHEQTAVKALVGRKIVTKAQYNLLYPQGGNPPSITDLDLTLATCLLRSLKSFRLNPRHNWSATPQQTDTSIEADLCRLRNTRNEIAHSPSTTGIDQATFQVKWNEIETVLLRLNNSVPNPMPNLQQELDEYKNSPLDPEAEEKIKEEIENLQQMEKNLESELQIVKKACEDVKGKVDIIEGNFEGVKGKVEKVTGYVDEVKGHVEENKKNIAAAHKKIDEELKMRKKTDEQKSVARKPLGIFQRLFPGLRMRKIKKDLKKDLIALYRRQYHTLPLSPLIEERDTPLLKFYVMPDMNSVEIQRSFGGGNEIKSKINSLRDVFYKKNKTCREIYLTADAGFGKTAFSRRLVLTWCQAKKRIKSDEKFFKEEDIQAMSEFEFVFLLSLRDCSEECDIDKMIVKQIIPRLVHTSVTVSDIETILSKGKGLVILDGLDEWIHPETTCKLGPRDIPHRKARECTILTTTRPWKLSVISLNSSQIDQKLELVGFNKTSATELKKNVISLLTGDNDEEKHIQDFNTTVKRKGISDLEVIPLLLMYLLCLWCDGIDLGRSKYVLYCQIVELLLKRTFKKYPAQQQAREPAQGDIPQYFSEHVHCKKNYILLQALGQLAFETLFSEKRESTLVFSQSVTERYLNKDDLELCLLSGILTQSKEVKLTSESSKVSFSHKTVQEYFCALYICSQNENDVKKIAQQKFNSVQNILDMSKVFVFISGMNAEIMSSISRELMSVISEDQITRTYRSMTNYDYRYVNPLKDIQNMYISCLKENTDNTSLCFQDFIIDEECQQENHFLNLKHLVIHNKRNIMSLSIQIKGIRCLRELIDQFELDDLHSVKKIFYQGECTKEAEIIRLLTNKSLECVTVESSTWQGNNFIHKRSSCSSELSKTFQNISQLRAIHIDCFKMEHDVLKEFLNYIINRKSMAEIRLYNLDCVTHDISCGGMNLDFSHHSDLRALSLGHIPVSQLKVNVSPLEDCNVGHLSKPGLFTSLLRELPAASKLHTFRCSPPESSGDIETLLQTLPLLVPVKDVWLKGINLGERSLSLSPEMVNIERVYLLKVTMPGSSLRNLVKEVEKLPHSVTVRMHDCNITPETEFADVKKYIKTSENFVVTFDGINQYGKYAFEFQTTEAGSRVH